MVSQRERHKDCESFVLDRVALGQVSLRALRFAPVSIIPPMLHNHLHLNINLKRRTTGRSLRNLKKNQRSFRRRKTWRETNIYVGISRVKKTRVDFIRTMKAFVRTVGRLA
jgi:REP element-mobilizing transposase RayT